MVEDCQVCVLMLQNNCIMITVIGVALMYEFDPVNFELQQVRKGYFPFFTGICAIFGGVFTVCTPIYENGSFDLDCWAY